MLLGVGLRSAPHASGSYGSSHTRLRRPRPTLANSRTVRSEEHTSELQSRSDLVCRLLLEKKKNNSLLVRAGEDHAFEQDAEEVIGSVVRAVRILLPLLASGPGPPHDLAGPDTSGGVARTR